MLVLVGEREALAADHTANPIIHRFFSFMASQAADGDQPLPEPHEDVLVQSIFNPQPSVVSKAQNDLQALSDHFKMKVQVISHGLFCTRDMHFF